MQLHVLGPVDALADGRSLPLGGPKPRAVLAMLALRANRTVTADKLIDGLWGEQAPASAAKMVQHYVWRLRTALGEDDDAEIVTRGRGYELRIDPDAVDVGRFERLLAAANRADEAGEPAGAAREALALWHGQPLSDVADEPFAAAEIRRLEELRAEAAELAIGADLAAGRQHEVAPEIDALIQEHPLRERLHAQRMLALYRCGRQADALAAYREARRTLVEEIGVEPGPELRRLHEAILSQDPALEVAAATPELPRELAAAGALPLAGRDAELAWLRAGWQRALGRSGELLTLVGDPGMGKTRLAAELAVEAHREGTTVLYVAGTGPCDAAVALIARARRQSRATLLVIDDADRACAEVRAELCARAPALASLVLVTGRDATVLEGMRPIDSLELRPLDAAAVRQIAVLHAPASALAAVPVDALVENSRGVPRRVHEAASAWARREAERRVEAVAGRAAAHRSQARELEVALAGSVVELQSTRERAGLVAPDDGGRLEPVVCPYKGLAPFDAEDAEYFCGREQLVAELVARLVGAQLLAVVGPSGSGKSSAVRAGLLPALAGGVLPGSSRWARDLIRPGEHPLRELRRAAGRLREAPRAVLVVDQFEELFTTCEDERERARFVDELVRAARNPDRVSVVVAARADFYGRCAAYPQLSALVGANHVLVGPMSRDELRRAIELPAQRAGLRLEPRLADRLLADCEGEPGALPLLSTALLELWQQRDGRQLPLAGYERTGGLRVAVARLAEAAYERLGREQQAVARRILLRLAGDEVEGTPVRRRVSRDEFDADRDENVRHVLDVLTDSRLITTYEGTVEVAHEALMREWPRLRAWLDEDTEGRRLHRQLIQAAREWNRRGRDRGDLYRGARLASALEWRAGHEPELNATEQQFLDASRAASGRARRRLRLVLSGVVALLVLATSAALIALDQRGQAQTEARAAAARALGSQALSEETLDRSLLLARQGVALDDGPVTRDSLLAVLRRSPAAIGVIRGDGDALTAVALHPDGRTLAVGDDDGTVLFLDAVTRRRLGRPHHAYSPSGVTSLAFSPDGTRLASARWDSFSGPFVDFYDGRTRRHIARTDPVLFHTLDASVHFSPDSRVVAARAADETSSRIGIWDARTARELPGVGAVAGTSSVLLGFIGSGERLVTSSEEDRATVIRDADTLRPLQRFAVSGSVAALSSAAGLVAFGARDGSVRVLDVRTGELRTARGRHDARVTAMRFNAGGDRLMSAGRDERLIVWDPRNAVALEVLETPGIGPVEDLAVARDGRTAYSAGRDGTVIAWDLSGERRWERPFGNSGTTPAPASLTVAARGSHFALIDDGGFVDVFESRTLRLSARIRPGPGQSGAALAPDPGRNDPLRPRHGQVTGAAVAPDGRTLAITTADGALQFWDARTRQPLGAPQTAHANAAWAVTFSADGRWLATGGGDSIIRLWDAQRRTARASRTLAYDQQSLSDMSLSPDGTMLALTYLNRNPGGGLEIRSVPSLEPIRTVPMPIGTVGRFSPDGRSLIYGDHEGRIWTLDTRTWKPRGPRLNASGPIRTADLSQDGQLLATTSADGSGRLWDVASGRPIGAALSGGSGDPIGAAFIGRSSQLAVVHERGGVAWDVRPRAWTRHACAIAARPLTPSEWEAVLPQHDYAPACAPR